MDDLLADIDRLEHEIHTLQEEVLKKRYIYWKLRTHLLCLAYYVYVKKRWYADVRHVQGVDLLFIIYLSAMV